MKKIHLLSLALFILSLANATIRTVCKIPAGVAQFDEIQPAVNASNSGDTILVQGSLSNYNGFTISKKLTVIGPGMKPLRNSIPQNLLTAKVQTITLRAGSDGSEIQGLEFQAGDTSIVVDTAISVNKLRVIRNHITSLFIIGYGGTSKTYSDYIIEGNWFDKTSILAGKNCSYSNFIIQNNLFFDSRITYFKNSFNVLINHNLFYKGGAIGSYYPFYNNPGCCDNGVYSQNLDIRNNIFYNANLTFSVNQNCTGSCDIIGFVNFYSLQNCSFKNNITFRCADNPWSINGNTDTANINNQSPQIADSTAILAGTNDPILNFTIAAGPANNSGTDGKDRGLLFDITGSLNWNNSRMSRIPYVYSFGIANPNITPGGQVQISVEARRNN